MHAVVARSTFRSQNVQMYKTHQVRTTFGSCDVEKVHTVVARSTFPAQNAKKKTQPRNTFGSSDVEKVHAIVAKAHFEVKMLNTLHVRTTFGGSDVVLRGGRKGFCTLPKVSKT